MKFKEMPYKRVDFEQASADLKQLMEKFEQAQDAKAQLAVHQEYYKLMDDIETEVTIASIRHSMDTSDKFYEGEKTYYNQKLPEFSALEIQYKNLLYASKYRPELEAVIGKPAFKNIELQAKSISEAVIPFKQEENRLTTKYENLLAGAKIEWEGETKNLSMMEPYLKNADRKIRMQAAEKVNAFYESIAEELDSIYDELVKNRTKQAEMLGFSSYTELGYCRMRRNSYGRAEVEQFRNAVKTYWVPLAEKVWENRRKRLNLEKLYHLDEGVSFPNGTPTPIGTPEEILAQGQKMYDALSPETREFFRFMMENELLDVFARQHKQVGGYMTYLPNYSAPFIFANFNGTAGDVDVITHECGHAFQGYLSGKDPVREHSDITMETAETHSMSMEFFTDPFMEQFFGERVEDFLLYQLEDAITFIPYGSMVDEFQHIVYDNPQLTPEQRKEEWKKLEKIYKPHLDYGEYSPFYAGGAFWQRQHHIYSLPFYYIDYAIAQTNALQYKVLMEQDRKTAWESYLTFCRTSASEFFVPMTEAAGLKNPFARGSIQELAEKIETLL